MSSYNRVIMVGNLTRDPELKQLPSGQAVCRIGLATNRQFKPKNATEPIQEVCFIDVDVWGNQAESCNKFLEKGSSILLEGRLKLDTWQDQEGQKRSKHSIVADRVTFLRTSQGTENMSLDENETYSTSESDKSINSASAAKKPSRGASVTDMGEVDLKGEEAFEDDLPF